MVLVAAGKTAFVTKKGYFGLGKQHSRRGDLVVILKGVSVPFLLQHDVDEHFSLDGETYVHGVMDSEFLNTKPQAQIFNIC
jgi:hypothetical protein